MMQNHAQGEPLKLHLKDVGHDKLEPLRDWLTKTDSIELACYLS